MGAIYKILSSAEWDEAVRLGAFRGSQVDRRDGYIHFSTANQVAETATRHFAGVDGLKLLAVDAEALEPNLKWEPARGGALFPHLYGALPVAAVVWVKSAPLDEGGRHVIPELQVRQP